CIHTQWRRYNAKVRSRTVGDVIPGSRGEGYPGTLSVPTATEWETDLAPKILKVFWNEAGAGNLLATGLGYNFTPGTSVVIGDRVLNAPDGLVYSGSDRLTFFLPTVSLATDTPLLVGTHGAPTEVVSPPEESNPGEQMVAPTGAGVPGEV